MPSEPDRPRDPAHARLPDPAHDADGSPATIVVVEPHGDDALLALGWTIRQWIDHGHEVTVATVFWPEDHRAREAEAWAAHVGAAWCGLGHRNAGRRGPRDPLPDPLLPSEFLGDETLRIWPLGFGHPDHRLVGSLAPVGDLRYVDTPYQLLVPLREEADAALGGTTIVCWNTPDPAKWDDASCFPSQDGLFRGLARELTGAPEIIVAPQATP